MGRLKRRNMGRIKKGKSTEEIKMKLYATKQELYDTCMKSEAGITIIAVAVYSEDSGEFLGYQKQSLIKRD